MVLLVVKQSNEMWAGDRGRIKGRVIRGGQGLMQSTASCGVIKQMLAPNPLGNTSINNVWRWVLFAGCYNYVPNWRDDLRSRFVTLLTAGSRLARRTGTLASPWVTLTLTACTKLGAVFPESIFRASWRKQSLLLNTLAIQCQISFPMEAGSYR